MSNTILMERDGAVAILRLNRPEALNALNSELMATLADHVADLDKDTSVGAIIVTGSEKAFAAGADIREIKDRTQVEMLEAQLLGEVDALERCRTPIIAAVSGFALGGGCELAMACDTIIAASSAKFGQPEIKLGVIPGLGGTQRLARAVGKAKAMDLVLTGRLMDADEAERAGLVARIVEPEELMSTALEMAQTIASYSRPSVQAGKDCVKRAFEGSLAEGLHHERHVFYSLFGLEDQKEGMAAFAEKRAPNFQHR
ncbi:MAG: enoyl-CoA hydratase-related protein [Pseudomonadota bacterium]